MSNILVVPSITKNLISIRQFSTENSCDFVFSLNCFFLTICHTGRILLRGDINQGLYALSSLSPTSQTCFISQVESLTYWHRRFGHGTFPTISRIFNKSLSSIPVCSTCLSSKSHKQSHPPTTNRFKAPVELVHFDVRGLAPVTLSQNNKYYVCFTNDYSKFSWFYLFHSHD